jgi:hypothetical protein
MVIRLKSRNLLMDFKNAGKEAAAMRRTDGTARPKIIAQRPILGNNSEFSRIGSLIAQAASLFCK